MAHDVVLAGLEWWSSVEPGVRAGRLEPCGGRHFRGEDCRVIVPDQPRYRAIEDQDWLLTWLPVSTDSLANF